MVLECHRIVLICDVHIVIVRFHIVHSPSLAIYGGGVRGSLTSEGPERSSEAGSTLLALGHYPRDPTFCSGQAVATAAI